MALACGWMDEPKEHANRLELSFGGDGRLVGRLNGGDEISASTASGVATVVIADIDPSAAAMPMDVELSDQISWGTLQTVLGVLHLRLIHVEVASVRLDSPDHNELRDAPRECLQAVWAWTDSGGCEFQIERTAFLRRSWSEFGTTPDAAGLPECTGLVALADPSAPAHAVLERLANERPGTRFEMFSRPMDGWGQGCSRRGG